MAQPGMGAAPGNGVDHRAMIIPEYGRSGLVIAGGDGVRLRPLTRRISAFDVVLGRPDLVVLLGITPDTDELEYGWIEPADVIQGPWPWPLFRVRTFWEKPSHAIAETLRMRGCLWNSFVMVAYPSALLSLIRSAVPALVQAFAGVASRLSTPGEDDSARQLYSGLPSTDFSTQVLAARPANLAVLRLGDVSWNDLGDPGRVKATLARVGACPAWA